MPFFKSRKKTSEAFNSVGGSGSPEYIICGLGNPGLRYENTRHNCGFMTLDLLAEWEKFKLKKLKFKSLTALASINGVKCFVMKPTTYMNLSGQAVVPAMEFYKIPPERTIIVYDDFSLPLGVVKIRRNGSDGGHNGMKSIILESDSDEFPRVKIGIGEPPHPKFPMKEWVTSHFRKDEGEKLELSLGRAAAAVSLMVKGDIEKAMNDFNANV